MDHSAVPVRRLLLLYALPATHRHRFLSHGRRAGAGFRLLKGAEQLRSFQPAEGVPKLFCGTCGSALFSGEPLADPEVAVRLGTLDRDPGIRPQHRQFVESAAPWEPIPEDGLERYPRSSRAT